ncbi:hypothetical protein AB0C65_02220 [Nocardia sp. NPDC048505]|uniref:hypothetical protein n=1 Tax=Nocardia sp. NPDC048505 TaxID=3155756 RepID=UPI0033DD207A
MQRRKRWDRLRHWTFAQHDDGRDDHRQHSDRHQRQYPTPAGIQARATETLRYQVVPATVLPPRLAQPARRHHVPDFVIGFGSIEWAIVVGQLIRIPESRILRIINDPRGSRFLEEAADVPVLLGDRASSRLPTRLGDNVRAGLDLVRIVEIVRDARRRTALRNARFRLAKCLARSACLEGGFRYGGRVDRIGCARGRFSAPAPTGNWRDTLPWLRTAAAGMARRRGPHLDLTVGGVAKGPYLGGRWASEARLGQRGLSETRRSNGGSVPEVRSRGGRVCGARHPDRGWLAAQRTGSGTVVEIRPSGGVLPGIRPSSGIGLSVRPSSDMGLNVRPSSAMMLSVRPGGGMIAATHRLDSRSISEICCRDGFSVREAR